jgi:hypothetical protein
VEYSFDGPGLRGTAGAIHRRWVGGAHFVLYGTPYLPCDYAGVEGFCAERKTGLMTVFATSQWIEQGRVRCGPYSVYDKRNRTPRMHYIDYGWACSSGIIRG